jgi:hypothetical protein
MTLKGISKSNDFIHEQISNDLKYLSSLILEKNSMELNWTDIARGVNFENDVFMMHTYCQCDEDGCVWCNGERPNFHIKESCIKVCWYKYIGRGMTHILHPHTLSEWKTEFDKCVKSLKE